MTENEKQLLLIDLCARLSYVTYYDLSYYGHKRRAVLQEFIAAKDPLKSLVQVNTIVEPIPYENIKPYLRPISSMTDEEMDKLFDILHINKDGNDEDWIKINDVVGIKFFFSSGKWIENVAEVYDYLNSIHIDYRGLVPMGLALEAPEGMYKTE